MNRSKSLWLAVLCVGGVLLGHASHADADRHRGQGKHHRVHQGAERGHSPPRHERRHANYKDNYKDAHRDARWYRSHGWQQHSGRYWAPANYLGRHCTDRRHHGGVHYHVALRDYYDYYYPRYRYHGALPLAAGPTASVIISIPLF